MSDGTPDGDAPDLDDTDGDDDGEESTWRFGLDEVGEAREPEPMEPGTPAPENAAFVLLGVALALVILYAAISGF